MADPSDFAAPLERVLEVVGLRFVALEVWALLEVLPLLERAVFAEIAFDAGRFGRAVLLAGFLLARLLLADAARAEVFLSGAFAAAGAVVAGLAATGLDAAAATLSADAPPAIAGRPARASTAPLIRVPATPLKVATPV